MKQDQDLFPHLGFPIRLEYQDKQEYKICWFKCQSHLDKHLTRYGLKAKDIKIDYQDESMITSIPFVNEEEVLPRKRGRKPKKQLFSSLEEFFE